MHACHVYATIKYLNLNLYYFCSPKLFHDPIRTTSSGCLMLPISEAIRDVEQTTAAHPSAKLRAPPSTTQVAQKARCLIKRRELFNNEKDSTSELYKVVAKSCNRLFVTITWTGKDILYAVGNGWLCGCETVSGEVLPQVEIPEKWTQEPLCFAITIWCAIKIAHQWNLVKLLFFQAIMG